MMLTLLFFIFFFKNACGEPELMLPGGETIPERGLHKAMFEPVLFPCNECMKLVDRYVKQCEKTEVYKQKVKTFLSFCESLAIEQDPKFNSSSYKFCLDIHSRIMDNHQQEGANQPDYNMFEVDAPEKFFLSYMHQCEKFQELTTAQCYSGFCEKYVQCIDCPAGLNLVDNENHYEFQVCSGHGICRLGWLHDEGRKGGNGFCECYEGRKGLACDQIVGKGFIKLPETSIQISKTKEADDEMNKRESVRMSEQISEASKILNSAKERTMNEAFADGSTEGKGETSEPEQTDIATERPNQ